MASALSSKVLSIQSLLTHFNTLLQTKSASTSANNAPSTQTDSSTTSTPSPNPLHILRDSVTLLKSHTTKLSLLLITPPFTPSAIQKVLQPCESSVIPAMMSGWQMLSSPLFKENEATRFLGGKVVREEIRQQIKDVVSGFETCLLLVLEKLNSSTSKISNTNKKSAEEDFKTRVLATTGLLWEACDTLTTTIFLEIPGIIAKKVEQFRATLDDAIEELREWGVVREKTPPTSDDEEEAVRSDGEEQDEEEEEEEEKYLDPLEGTLESLPAHRADLRTLHFTTMKELRLTSTFMRAVVKHRIKTLPKSTTIAPGNSTEGTSQNIAIEGLDTLVDDLRNVPDMVDDLAAGFYEGEAEDVEEQLRELVGHVRGVGGLAGGLFLKSLTTKSTMEPAEAGSGSTARTDAFSTWVEKWDAAVTEALAELKT